MKKNYFILLILFIGFFINQTIAQTTIPNAGFENWSDAYNATSWNSVNFLTIHSIQRSTDSHSGTYAAKMSTQTVLGNTIPGITALGTIDMVNKQVNGGIPFSGKPIALNGFFKYNPIGNDSMLIGVILTRTTAGVQDTIGGGIFTNKTTVSSYTPFTLPIYYNTNITGNPDTLNIVFLATSIATGGNGTTLFIDDLSFEYSSNEIKENHSIECKIYPNPASDLITISCKNIASNPNQVIIYNLAGQIIYNNTFTASQFKINVADFNEGIYFIKVSNNNLNKIQKLIVKHSNE